VAGYGAGALIFDQVSTAYTNPENVPLQGDDDDAVDDDDFWTGYINCDDTDTDGSNVCSRASSLYLVLGCSYAALILLGALLIGEPAGFVIGGSGDGRGGDADNAYHSLEDDGGGAAGGEGRYAKEQITAADNDVPEAAATEQQPRTMGQLMALHTARLTTASYIFTATPGVFIAGNNIQEAQECLSLFSD
jgi:hypothetical protein